MRGKPRGSWVFMFKLRYSVLLGSSVTRIKRRFLPCWIKHLPAKHLIQWCPLHWAIILWTRCEHFIMFLCRNANGDWIYVLFREISISDSLDVSLRAWLFSHLENSWAMFMRHGFHWSLWYIPLSMSDIESLCGYSVPLNCYFLYRFRYSLGWISLSSTFWDISKLKIILRMCCI